MILTADDHKMYQEYKAARFQHGYMRAYKRWYENGGRPPLSNKQELIVRTVQNLCNKYDVQYIADMLGVHRNVIGAVSNRSLMQISETALEKIETYIKDNNVGVLIG